MSDSDVIDFYKEFGADDPKKRYFNPNPEACEHPFIACIIGKTGSGKSNLVLNIIRQSKGSFHEIYVFSGCPSHDFLYDELEKKCNKSSPGSFLRFEDPGSLIGAVMAAEDDEKAISKTEGAKYTQVQRLVIFDDFIGKKGIQNPIDEFTIMSRKFNASVVCLSQNYYEINKTTRKQANYLFLMHSIGKRDLSLLCNSCPDIDPLLLKRMYYSSTRGKKTTNFLMVDMKTSDEDLRFRNSSFRDCFLLTKMQQ